MKVSLRKLPLEMVVETVQALIDTPPLLMVYYRGKPLLTTLPSKFLRYG